MCGQPLALQYFRFLSRFVQERPMAAAIVIERLIFLRVGKKKLENERERDMKVDNSKRGQ